MSPFRPLAALAAAGILLATPQLLPASASPAAPDGASAPVGAAHQTPLIEGVVVDQFGKYVDDVEVLATRAPRDTPAASALTYASEQDGGPQHGYFFLEVGKKGTYTLSLSKAGYEAEDIGSIRVKRVGQTIDLGEIEILKMSPTTTSASLARRTVTTREHGEVDVVVRTRATSRPVGDVEVREGRRVVGEDSLRRGDRGEVQVSLERLSKGSHVLKVYFLGGDGLRPSSSPSLTLVVRKAGR